METVKYEKKIPFSKFLELTDNEETTNSILNFLEDNMTKKVEDKLKTFCGYGDGISRIVLKDGKVVLSYWAEED